MSLVMRFNGTIVLALLLGAATAHAEPIPGPLSKTHSFLSGPTLCTKCHDAAKKPAGFKCLSCHADIRKSLEEKRAGLHSSLIGNDRSGRGCKHCHSEHRGSNVSLIHWSNAPCSTCHEDVHKGQFAGTRYGNRCENCHTVNGFKPSTFTLVRHRETRFPLAGAHEAIVCAECHKNSQETFPARQAQFHFNDLSCAACHSDPHRGEFSQRMSALKPDGNPAGCAACHSTRGWHELSGFDHSSTSFVLAGAHSAVSCEQCHKSENLETSLKNVAFNSAPLRCSGCHDDIHGGQFLDRMGSADCAKCHQVWAWKPSTFNHQTDSAYPLETGHKMVDCAQCHTASKEISGSEVTIYKETPHRCVECHSNNVKTAELARVQ
jgi:hypothetical protein